jgi:U3 small nucleolar RNA-associated protein 5
MSLEERLNVMGIDNENENDNENVYLMKNGQMPKTDNLLVLLVQGLQSNDAKMLNHVLQHKNEKVVSKTVRMLPTNYVIILVKELNKRLQGHAQSGMGLIKWLKCLLMSHTSFLMSYPDLIDSLGSVYEMMSARTKLFPQLAKLQGKLQLVMSQVSSQTESLQTSNVHNNNNNNVQPTLLFYQDSTSEDEQIEDELIPSHSEFEDYVFSDEEEEEEEDSTSGEEEEEEDDEEATIIKKDIVNFKKTKQNQTIKTKNNKSKLDKEE